MKENEIKELLKLIEELEKAYNFNDYIKNYIDEDDLKELNDDEDLRCYLEELNEDREITNTDVIYYNDAIKYLSENDASLNESLEIAEEFDYTTKQLNSELLASLLKSRNNSEDYSKFIQTIFKEFEVKNE